jgi:hypothetical protein
MHIAALATSGQATDATITPLFHELNDALRTAKTGFYSLEPAEKSKRQTNNELAEILAGIVTVCASFALLISVC